ncbi:TPA: cell envelope integrity protein TolA [Vibrio cholerae]
MAKESQKEALDRIFNGINGGSAQTASITYATLYTEKVRERLGDISEYKGFNCRALVSLSNNGIVEHVDISSQNILCRKIFNAVWDISTFPLPENEIEASKLKKFSLSVSP